MKSDFIVNWIKDFVEITKKLVVYTYHRKVMEFLKEKFKENSVYVYGGVAGKQREKAINDFIEKDDINIFFAQLLSVGVGVDGLQQVCSNCAFVEFADNSTDHDQGEDRLHRSGQKDSVNCYYLIGENTIDEIMIENLDEKRKVANAVVDGIAAEESFSLTKQLKERM